MSSPIPLLSIFFAGIAAAGLVSHIGSAMPRLQERKERIDANIAHLSLLVVLGTFIRVVRKSLPWPLGGCPRLPVNEDRTGYALPSIEIEAPLRVTRKDLETYLGALDSTLPGGSQGVKDQRVPTMFLPAVTSSLFILLASHAQTPIAMLGAVNTENVFEYLDPSVLGSFDALAEKEWRVVGRMSGSALRKKRGCEWAMTIDICDTKTGKAVFRATWKALKFMSSKKEPRYDASKEAAPAQRTEVEDVPPIDVSLRPTLRSTKLYAGSSGDYNLIHVSPLLAKYLFGLPTAIAHGNLMVAAAARALELHAPDSALSQQWRGAKPFRVIVAFRSIMAISRTFELRAGEGRFLVAGKGKVCVDGKSEEM